MVKEIKYTKNKEIIELANQDRKALLNQVYQHYKGALYIVDSVARHTETGEQMVVYRSLDTGQQWVRPKDMFLDIIQKEEGYTFRFTKFQIGDFLR
ncbi:DUF1653 domain-containing protein [Virgibacillus salexigens]|uniref:DUF1653 domain-containing protein n=1 Tax=Virgibacillus massiliensis TaxID=1462526 RepID=A0A024QHA6_9BACI|nr:DUF1653 domain-containing protein [Virgibacillus massiliensis]CDQ41879.1 hypothetical protein BN990_04258 [Virgibacillus massiliensis]